MQCNSIQMDIKDSVFRRIYLLNNLLQTSKCSSIIRRRAISINMKRNNIQSATGFIAGKRYTHQITVSIILIFAVCSRLIGWDGADSLSICKRQIFFTKNSHVLIPFTTQHQKDSTSKCISNARDEKRITCERCGTTVAVAAVAAHKKRTTLPSRRMWFRSFDLLASWKQEEEERKKSDLFCRLVFSQLLFRFARVDASHQFFPAFESHSSDKRMRCTSKSRHTQTQTRASHLCIFASTTQRW